MKPISVHSISSYEKSIFYIPPNVCQGELYSNLKLPSKKVFKKKLRAHIWQEKYQSFGNLNKTPYGFELFHFFTESQKYSFLGTFSHKQTAHFACKLFLDYDKSEWHKILDKLNSVCEKDVAM